MCETLLLLAAFVVREANWQTSEQKMIGIWFSWKVNTIDRVRFGDAQSLLEIRQVQCCEKLLAR